MMSIALSTRDRGGHVVVRLRGELDLTSAGRAAEAVRKCAAGGRQVIVDVAALEFIDCYSLVTLLRVQKLARLSGGDVLLAHPRGRVLRMLNLTGLADTFCAHATVAAAAASVGRSARCADGPPNAELSGVAGWLIHGGQICGA
jgi:anti-sigma B factor antagonist